MNYEDEVGKINEGSGEVFKPTVGVHQIEILEEPEPTTYVDEATGKETPQIKLRIKIDNEEKAWFVTKGLTFKSLYGQLMALGKHNKKLKNEKITLSVTTSKNKKTGANINSYSVLEAVKILPSVEKAKVLHPEFKG